MEKLHQFLDQGAVDEIPRNRIPLKIGFFNASDSNSEASNAASTDGFTCNKCSESIDERYFVMMDNKEWHTNCLWCDICHKNLGHQISCFEKDNLIFCKECYARAGLQTCQYCSAAILKSEFVFKCNCSYFHWECFFCIACKVPLRKGQKFGMIDSMVYCEEHFLAAREGIEQNDNAVEADSVADFFLNYGTSLQHSDFQVGPLEMHIQSTCPSPDFYAYEMSQMDFMLPNASLNITEHFEGMLSPPAMRAAMLHGKNRCKRKRARTSFRQEQLKELRTAFALNQNPDTTELMRMSQQIGLSKRVLQVWFQNARAKQRRDQSKGTYQVKKKQQRQATQCNPKAVVI